MSLMDPILQRLVDNHFADLAGFTVDASIPVPETLLNELITAALEGNKNITDCRVTIGEQNRMDVQCKTPLWPWPLDLKLKLFRSVDLTGSPRVRAFLENNKLLGRLGSLIKALPEGVTLYQDQVAVDLGRFLRTQQQKKFLELIRSAEIRTEAHKMIIDVRIES